MSAERLQKLMARAGIASRRKVEELILEGRVTVNGRVATLGDKADLEVDSVKLDGKRVRPPERQRYLLLNKPKGVLTTVADEKGRQTVMDLVPEGLRNGLFPVGRLDFHTEGLLILTTDGELALRIAHPRYGCRKLYEVKVKGVPREEEIERLRRGIVLDGRRTLPAHIVGIRRTSRTEDEGNTWYEVQLGEGRSRQIREMFFRIGHPVQKLKRVAIGPLRDAKLASGTFRTLTEDEVEALRKAGEGSGPAGRGGEGRGEKRPTRRFAGPAKSGPLPVDRRPAGTVRRRSDREGSSAGRERVAVAPGGRSRGRFETEPRKERPSDRAGGAGRPTSAGRPRAAGTSITAEKRRGAPPSPARDRGLAPRAGGGRPKGAPVTGRSGGPAVRGPGSDRMARNAPRPGRVGPGGPPSARRRGAPTGRPGQPSPGGGGPARGGRPTRPRGGKRR